MKTNNIFYIMAVSLAVIVGGCVDDYTDANPPHQKDAPAIRVTTTNSSSQIVRENQVNAYQTEPEAFVVYGQATTFTVTVIDAPGIVSTASVTSSVPDFGTVAIDEGSLSALQGAEQGSFKFTFTPNPDLSSDEDRSFNLTVKVSDSQKDEKNEDAPKTTSLTIPVTIVSPCVSSGIQPGYYKVSAATGNIDGGTPFTLQDLRETMVSEIVVEVSEDRPGLYTFNEVTGGVWPAFYSGRANPKLKVNLCGNTITGHVGDVSTGVGTTAQRTFTLNGSLNGDGTITMTWSYKRDTGGATPANPAKGTYTLTHL